MNYPLRFNSFITVLHSPRKMTILSCYSAASLAEYQEYQGRYTYCNVFWWRRRDLHRTWLDLPCFLVDLRLIFVVRTERLNKSWFPTTRSTAGLDKRKRGWITGSGPGYVLPPVAGHRVATHPRNKNPVASCSSLFCNPPPATKTPSHGTGVELCVVAAVCINEMKW